MFGFMYVVLTAKPVSIRRLCLLYVFLLASARCLLSVLHVEHAASLALAIATAISLLVWVSPLVRVLFGAVFDRRIALEAFETVSARVQFTYGFVLVMLPVIALETWLTVPHAPVRALIPAIAWAWVSGAGFMMTVQRFKGRGSVCRGRTTNGRVLIDES
jgi:hypothetical protein